MLAVSSQPPGFCVLFTFLSHPEVPGANNHGEREVRFVLLILKNMYGNRSDESALIQGFLISYIPHSETARLQSYRDPRGRPAGICAHRAPAAFPTG